MPCREVSPTSSPDPDKVVALTNRAIALRELATSTAWAELRAIADERRQEFFRTFAKTLMRGEPVDQRKVDYTAGYYQGIADLLRAPEKAESEMRSALKRAERYLASEGDSE